MSHGTAAPTPGRAAGNGLSAAGAAAGTGLPVPGGAAADGGHPSSAPPAVRVRGARRSFEAELAPVRALRGLVLIGPLSLLAANLLAAWPGQRAARLRSAQILRAE
jgi:hypothetical protein